MDVCSDWQHVLHGTDVETAQLIIQLQAEDIAAFTRNSELHNGPESADNEFARRVMQDELRRCQADQRDRKLGEDIEDGANEHERAAETAAYGWAYDHWADRVEEGPPEPIKTIECTSCTEHVPADQAVKAPCGHDYCDECLDKLYTDCLTDETLFSPRCCHGEFSWIIVRHHLSQRTRSKFGSKRIELETTDRTYCYDPTCSAFIPPATYMPATTGS
ncbi:hypothetical protein LTR62_003432 [Meristemomyces frigidus]|uniref:RING-type domain-containing protein n=1 Tax=Meristemomyces frigidus TaxID=1508187 RepID=A0AAN7YGV0_9PEZI|nr:hypothetical protein LTR62_003432 [Meristemomyces frigidus]